MQAETPIPSNPELRRKVRRALEGSTAFEDLEPARKRALAKDMVEVLSYLSDPAAGDESLRDMADEVPATPAMADPVMDAPVLATGMQVAQPNAQVSGATADKTADTIRSFVSNVDFPEFVSSLIDGVFTSIVDASIKQMEAYQDLLANVVKSVNQFAKDNFSDDDARNYVASNYPGRLQNTGGRLSLLQDGSSENPDFGALVGSNRSFDLFNPADERALVQAAKLQMARLRQQQLATMVVLGLNRIVVTDGRINAKVVFDVRASETASALATSESSDIKSTIKTTNKKNKSFWGSTRSTEKTVTTNVSTFKTETETESTAKIEAKAKLTGEVQVNFRSETFPLEKLAAPEQVGQIQQLQQTGGSTGGSSS